MMHHRSEVTRFDLDFDLDLDSYFSISTRHPPCLKDGLARSVAHLCGHWFTNAFELFYHPYAT